MLKFIKIIFFFIFKKLFLRSTHQNDPKYIKKLIFSKKINFFWKHGYNRVSKHSLKRLEKCWERSIVLKSNEIRFRSLVKMMSF